MAKNNRSNSRVSQYDPHSEHHAIRLFDLDFSRATEQTAILMGLIMGRGRGVQASDVRTRVGRPTDKAVSDKRAFALAVSSVMGYLACAPCAASVVDKRETKTLDVETIWGSTKHAIGLESSGLHTTNWSLDLVISPVEGLPAVLEGEDGGSISVLAGGTPGSFPVPRQDLAAYQDVYCVLATPAGTEIPRAGLGSGMGKRTSLAEFLFRADFVKALLKQKSPATEEDADDAAEAEPKRRNGAQLTLCAPADLDRLPAVLREQSRLRVMRGSPVEAALSVCLGKFGIDAFVGVMDRVQATLTAVAARVTGSDFLAIPLKPNPKCPKGKGESASKRRTLDTVCPYFVPCGAELCSTEHFVKEGNDVFVVATGITEGLALKGVRLSSDGSKVATQSLCLRSHTSSLRFITHHHELGDKKRLRLLPPSPGGHTDAGYDPAKKVDAKRYCEVDLEKWLYSS